MNRDADIRFLIAALGDLAELTAGGKVLDLGCGAGAMVEKLQEAGFDAWGCDGEFGSGTEFRRVTERLRRIEICPYRLPFEDCLFDAVVTVGVLEHVSNKDEIFSEIYRILKHGGTMIHVFPSKWYLPVEPHIFVPFVNWMWPRVPRWWLALWAIAGVRNSFQSGMSWRQVVDANLAYCRAGLDYWSFSRLIRCIRSRFGQCRFADQYHLGQRAGILAQTCQALPFGGSVAWLLRMFRMSVVVATKSGALCPATPCLAPNPRMRHGVPQCSKNRAEA